MFTSYSMNCTLRCRPAEGPPLKGLLSRSHCHFPWAGGDCALKWILLYSVGITWLQATASALSLPEKWDFTSLDLTSVTQDQTVAYGHCPAHTASTPSAPHGWWAHVKGDQGFFGLCLARSQSPTYVRGKTWISFASTKHVERSDLILVPEILAYSFSHLGSLWILVLRI